MTSDVCADFISFFFYSGTFVWLQIKTDPWLVPGYDWIDDARKVRLIPICLISNTKQVLSIFTTFVSRLWMQEKSGHHLDTFLHVEALKVYIHTYIYDT